jgi:hypothetical protein
MNAVKTSSIGFERWAIKRDIAELRVKYENAIAHKLKMREFMKKVVITWKNAKISQYWR